MLEENPNDHHALSAEDREALPDKVRKYISSLESKLHEYEQSLTHTKDQLRRKNFAYWKR
jgi:hypothetical protein